MKCETVQNNKNNIIARLSKQLSAVVAAYMPTTLKDLTWKEEKPKMMLCPCNGMPPVSNDDYQGAVIDDYSSTY